MDDTSFWLQVVQSPTASTLSAGGILLINVLLILRGQLVPKLVVDQLRAGYEDRIAQALARGDEYRTAWEKAMKTVEVKDDQIGKLLKVGEFANHVFEAIPSPVHPPTPYPTADAPQTRGSLSPEAH